jgi:vacuolar-type H+-ATPase subunit F/Vma7
VRGLRLAGAEVFEVFQAEEEARVLLAHFGQRGVKRGALTCRLLTFPPRHTFGP